MRDRSFLARWSFALGCLLYAAALSAAPRTLLVLGDSLSAAYGMETKEGWVALLEQRMAGRGLDWRVVNASVSGETTGGGLSRLPKLLEDHDPALVIIELGGNDGLRGLAPGTMHDNLAAMIDKAQASDARVLLVGMRIPPNYGPLFAGQFEQTYTRLARAKRVPLVPFLLEGVAGNDKFMQTDGIHATADAQPRLLDNVWPQLTTLLR